MADKEVLYQRIKEKFENTVESNNLKYDGTVKDIDYFSLFCKASSEERVTKLLGLNTCMFNYVYENEESVLILFYIPINTDSSSKHIADRVMEVVRTMEVCFTTLDFVKSMELRDEKFVYVTVIKKLRNNVLKGD